jgi:hypothetical protein
LKRILFDQNVPAPPKQYFHAYDVHMADEMGWPRLKNGQLLDAAEAAAFDVLLSSDKTIRFEQNMAGRKIAMVYMSDNHWPSVGEYWPSLVEAFERIQPGEVCPVFCDIFAPKKFRKPAGPSERSA